MVGAGSGFQTIVSSWYACHLDPFTALPWARHHKPGSTTTSPRLSITHAALSQDSHLRLQQHLLLAAALRGTQEVSFHGRLGASFC